MGGLVPEGLGSGNAHSDGKVGFEKCKSKIRSHEPETEENWSFGRKWNKLCNRAESKIRSVYVNDEKESLWLLQVVLMNFVTHLKYLGVNSWYKRNNLYAYMQRWYNIKNGILRAVKKSMQKLYYIHFSRVKLNTLINTYSEINQIGIFVGIYFLLVKSTFAAT